MQPSIADNGWQLSSYKIPNEAERTAYSNGALSFYLQSQVGLVSGFIECNAYSGNYTMDGSILSISDIAVDQADCTEANDHYREQNLLISDALSQQLEVKLQSGTVTLKTSDGSTLYFTGYADVFINPPLD